jgi:hypothetical protein
MSLPHGPAASSELLSQSLPKKKCAGKAAGEETLVPQRSEVVHRLRRSYQSTQTPPRNNGSTCLTLGRLTPCRGLRRTSHGPPSQRRSGSFSRTRLVCELPDGTDSGHFHPDLPVRRTAAMHLQSLPGETCRARDSNITAIWQPTRYDRSAAWRVSTVIRLVRPRAALRGLRASRAACLVRSGFCFAREHNA